MKERFPEVWKLVLNEMVQNKHSLFSGVEMTVLTMKLDEPTIVQTPTPWMDILLTITSAHARSAVGPIFDRNPTTRNKRWKQDGYSEFVSMTIDEIFDDVGTEDLIITQERLYNTGGENNYTFVNFVTLFCNLVELTVNEDFSSDKYLGTYWEERK